jgi:hypothetical protein
MVLSTRNSCCNAAPFGSTTARGTCAIESRKSGLMAAPSSTRDPSGLPPSTMNTVLLATYGCWPTPSSPKKLTVAGKYNSSAVGFRTVSLKAFLAHSSLNQRSVFLDRNI